MRIRILNGGGLAHDDERVRGRLAHDDELVRGRLAHGDELDRLVQGAQLQHAHTLVSKCQLQKLLLKLQTMSNKMRTKKTIEN